MQSGNGMGCLGLFFGPLVSFVYDLGGRMLGIGESLEQSTHAGKEKRDAFYFTGIGLMNSGFFLSQSGCCNFSFGG